MPGVQFTAHELIKRHNKDQEVHDIHEDHIDQMAQDQQDIEHALSKLEAVKQYKLTFVYAFAIIWTMVLVGYESQAGGMVFSIPQFREDFGHAFEGEYVLDASWQSAIGSAPVASMAIAYIAGSWLSDRVGRRRVLLVASLFSIPFITLEFVATTIEEFFVGKFMNGFALGAIASCCLTYMSEIAPMALRGVYSGAIALALCIGPFICVLINNTTSTYTTRMAYRGIFIPQWIFAAISICFQLFLPESPYWLLLKNRDKDALKQLQRIYPEESIALSQFALMKVTVKEASVISAKSGTYLDAFKKKDIKRTMMIIFSFSMQPMSGVAYVGGYSTYYFQRSGFDTQKSFQISCGAQALSIAGVISSFFIIDRFGRRPLIVAGMIAITILNLIVSITGLFTSNVGAMKTSSAFIAMYNYVYNIGIGPVPYIIGNELSSVFLRAKTLSIGSFANNALQCLWMSVLPYMFNADQANMGSKINFIFTGFSTVSVFVFYFFLPETSHRSFEDIDELFALGVNPRKWKDYNLRGENLPNEQKGSSIDHLEDTEEVQERLTEEKLSV